MQPQESIVDFKCDFCYLELRSEGSFRPSILLSNYQTKNRLRRMTITDCHAYSCVTDTASWLLIVNGQRPRDDAIWQHYGLISSYCSEKRLINTKWTDGRLGWGTEESDFWHLTRTIQRARLGRTSVNLRHWSNKRLQGSENLQRQKKLTTSKNTLFKGA